MKAGDTIEIGTGADKETRKIAGVGTAATGPTTLWQPLPEGPVITIPAGSTNVPVTSAEGFEVGQKIAIGYGATYPAVAKSMETVRSGHGHRGRQAGHAGLAVGGRQSRRHQHQGVLRRKHLGRRQDPAGHRQQGTRDRDRHGQERRHGLGLAAPSAVP